MVLVIVQCALELVSGKTDKHPRLPHFVQQKHSEYPTLIGYNIRTITHLVYVHSLMFCTLTLASDGDDDAMYFNMATMSTRDISH